MPRGRPRKVVPDMREGVPMAQPSDEAALFDSELVQETKDEQKSESTPEVVAEPETKPEPKIEAREPEPKKEGIAAQLEAQKTAEELNRRLQEEALKRQQERAQWEQRYAQWEDEKRQLKGQLDESEYGRTDENLKSAQEAIEAAKRELVQAKQDGDSSAEAEAVAKIGLWSNVLVQANERKESLEARRKQQEELGKQPQQQQQQQQQQPRHPWGSDAEIDSFGLTSTEKDMLRNHRQLLTNETNRVALVEYVNSLGRRGIGSGHAEFMPRIMHEFGITQPEPESKPESKRTPIVSAPVSRETPGSRQDSKQTTLTAEEVEAARISGITPAEYARQKLKIKQMEADGQYSRQGGR